MSAMLAKKLEVVLEDMGFEVDLSFTLDADEATAKRVKPDSLCRIYSHHGNGGVRVLYNNQCDLVRVKCDRDGGTMLNDFVPSDVTSIKRTLEEMITV